MRLVLIWSALLTAMICMPKVRAQSQTAADDLSLKSVPKQFLRDEARIWTSPFRRHSYTANGFKKYVVPFVLVTGALIATDRKVTNALPNSADQLKWSGRISQIGSAYGLAGISGSAYLAGKFIHDDHLRETGLLSLEALGHSQIAVFALKEITNRERPLDNGKRGGFWEGGTSFPSGHSAGAFAVATVFAYEYQDRPVVPIAAYSLATLVAASRVGADKHWVSDIVAGGSLGFLMGRFTYKRRHSAGHSARLMPAITFSRTAPALSWAF